VRGGTGSGSGCGGREVGEEVSVEKPKSRVYIVCIDLFNFCHLNGPWPVLTAMGLISGPPQLIGLFLEADSFIITAFVNRCCKAVSCNRLVNEK
jgi:hypothetical protein